MGLSISIPEDNSHPRIVRNSRRHMRRDTVVSQTPPTPSDKYSVLDINQKHHSVNGDIVTMDKQFQKSSGTENERMGDYGQHQQKKVDVIRWKVINQESKSTLQTIPIINTGQLIAQEQQSNPQPVEHRQQHLQIKEVVQISCNINKQAPIKSVNQDQSRVCRIKGEAHTVDLKRTPVKKWIQHVERSPLPDGKQDFTVEMRQVSLVPNTQNIKRPNQMQSYYRSKQEMPSINVILSTKLAQQANHTKQEEDSLKNMRQAMKQLLSVKLNTNQKNSKLKQPIAQILSLQASRLAHQI